MTLGIIKPPDENPDITFIVYSGGLGVYDGTLRSVYVLDITGLSQHTGDNRGPGTLELTPGSTADLPNCWGTVTWEIAFPENPVKRFASLQTQRDPSAGGVLAFALLATLGLFAGLLVPRRRLWVKARVVPDGVGIEYAELARGEGPAPTCVVTKFATRRTSATTAGDAFSLGPVR